MFDLLGSAAVLTAVIIVTACIFGALVWLAARSARQSQAKAISELEGRFRALEARVAELEADRDAGAIEPRGERSTDIRAD